MQPRTNHTQEEVRSVILQGSAEDLLVNWNSGCAFDTTEGVDGRSNTQIANTLNIDGDFGLRSWPLRIALGGDLSKSNPDGTDIAPKHVTTVERLPCPHCIIQTFKIDCGEEHEGGRSSRN